MSRIRRRSRASRIIDSGILQAYSLDAAALTAFALIGVSVYQLAPALLWGYAGLVLLLIVLAVGKTAAKTTEKQG